MKRTLYLAIVTALVVLTWTTGVMAQDAAMIVDMQGEAAVFDSGDKKGQEVLLMDFLAQGDRIKLGDTTVLILNYFASGAREEIDGPGVITVGEQGSEKTDGSEIKTAKVDYIPPPTSAEGKDQALHVGTVALRGMSPASPELLPLGPTDTAVRALPLTFRWRPISGAEKYILTLSDKDGKKLFAKTVVAPECLCEKASVTRGREYWWKVEAAEADGVIAEGGGKFYVLSDKDMNQVALTEQYITKHYPGESDESRIAMAMLYKKYQLNDEAKDVLMGLSKKHPRNANIVRQLNELKTNYNPKS
jgi:hypothetical protein